MSRKFEINPPVSPVPPLLIGILGPPAGGKTKSSLRIAAGMSRVRGGKPALIDTEKGRSLKHRKGPHNPNGHDFDYIPFDPPFVPEHFLDAIREAAKLKPSAIIVDSMSDEHEGEGGVLDWHDQAVPQMGGNEWAAWSKPKASRRKLISGIQQFEIPLIFTFRAREKTRTEKVTKNGRTREVPVNIGYQPIAPMEIVHTLDLTCLLPPRANGVALWESPKEGEDFVIKFPDFLQHLISRGMVLNEDFGEALARWQVGDAAPAKAAGERKRSPEELVDDYCRALGSKGSLEELMAFQTAERTVKFVEAIQKSHPALFDRILTANATAARNLSPPDEDPGDDVDFGDADPTDD